MDHMKRNRIWTPPAPPGGGRLATPNRPAGRPPSGLVVPDQPRLIDFQPLITVMVPNSTAAEASAIQPFSGWFDGADITEVHFKVEVLQTVTVKLILESAPTIDPDVDQWDELASWTAVTTNPPEPDYDILTAVSSCEFDGSGTSPVFRSSFSRYIRWRVEKNGAAGRVCFRIIALTGSSFTQFAEKPRVV
jgi:hypothetical protein